MARRTAGAALAMLGVAACTSSDSRVAVRPEPLPANVIRDTEGRAEFCGGVALALEVRRELAAKAITPAEAAGALESAQHDVYDGGEEAPAFARRVLRDVGDAVGRYRVTLISADMAAASRRAREMDAAIELAGIQCIDAPRPPTSRVPRSTTPPASQLPPVTSSPTNPPDPIEPTEPSNPSQPDPIEPTEPSNPSAPD